MASKISGALPRLIVMRHGERADAAKELAWKDPNFPYDPPLTAKGHEQAKEAGAYIKSQFPSLSGLRVISSPFLRCLQTATHVADALEQATVEVIPQFSDILSEYGFIYSEVKWRWAEKQIDSTHQIDTDRFILAPDSEYPVFGETNESAATRLREAFLQLRTRYPSDNILLVSHWYSLEVAMGLRDSSIPTFKAGYCAMLELNPSNWDVVSFKPDLASKSSIL